MCDTLNISYDVFQRTTDEAHYKASQAIWQAMEANGDLYLDRYEGWYSVRDEAFYDESELVAGEGARSCLLRERRWNGPLRKAGSSASRPIRNPAGALCRHPEFISPESRRNEVVKFVEGGAICRSRAPALTGVCRCPVRRGM
jgi:methionyl-tRNA synthetase